MRQKQFDQLLVELQKEYLLSLPSRIANIQRFWTNKDVVGVQEEFHRLKGTGATYGIPEISELGALGELACQKSPRLCEHSIGLAVGLLERIRQARETESHVRLDHERDYQELLQLWSESV